MSFDPATLEHYPAQPGVYLMKGSAGHVLYVGKAKNLKQRLRQYFTAGGDGRFMIPFLVEKVVTIDTIVVTSEKEALLLENNLIKQHRPKFNALLKDDKSYIALKVTNKQLWPTLQLVRYKGKPPADGLYFGPYTSALAARATFDLLSRLFPLRQCSDREFANRQRPCILYDMQRCIAPCVGKCTSEEYQNHVQKTIKFLRGQDREIVQELYGEMERAAEALEFERASAVLQTIRQIETTIETQRVDKPLGEDLDALAIFRQGDEVIVNLLLFRGGKLNASQHYNFSSIAQSDQELIASFLLQHYEGAELLPQEILLPVEIAESAEIVDILSQGRKRKVSLVIPQRGDKKALVEMAYVNAEAIFKREKDQQALRQKVLLDMEEKFRLHTYPRRIECIDTSNLAGSNAVAVMVAYTDGEKDSGRYRKYHIKTGEGPDDYGAMREVLQRRCRRGKGAEDLPDLIVIDGGKGHLNMAIKALAELDIVTIDLIAVAKEQGRHDKGMTAEQIFLPNIKDPIQLRHTSPILFFLQQVRDEAHRFAIAFHRLGRRKKLISSTLDAIRGIGPAKRTLLLKHFGSVKAIKAATPEELKGLKGITAKDVEAIIGHFTADQQT
jgi:excinuclease ABC subunit C